MVDSHDLIGLLLYVDAFTAHKVPVGLRPHQLSSPVDRGHLRVWREYSLKLDMTQEEQHVNVAVDQKGRAPQSQAMEIRG